ncbi:hypothetical protein M3B63_03130 [Lysinibacillus capsici]|uniref:hypothetical protein n=1 Tax=Lysinibacillus capsici TaxID=2115968 RepID=UPI0021A7EAC9|nr:hypothetical protein [Lysinibacillus capsici]MCT1538329.1 hypothetical protein [Lysinibacillus capsici]
MSNIWGAVHSNFWGAAPCLTIGVQFILEQGNDLFLYILFLTKQVNWRIALSLKKYRPAMYVMLRTNLLGAGRSVFP